MKIRVVQGDEATKLIENYLSEAPTNKTNTKPSGPPKGGKEAEYDEGEFSIEEWEKIHDMSIDDLLDWDSFAAKQTQGVDKLFDIAYGEMPDYINEEGKGDIEASLDKILKVSKQNADKRDTYAALVMKYGKEKVQASGFECPNLVLLIEGDAGCGKTARTKSWAEENGCNLLVKMLSSMDETDLGGTPYAEEQIDKKTGEKYHVLTKLPATELDDLRRKNSVLFLDEYNRGNKAVRNTALKLINEHCIPDSRSKSGMRYFRNLLFVVMAVNPPSYGGVRDPFDPAEKNRVKHIKVESDPLVTRKFIWKNYTNQIRIDLQMGNREEAARDYGRREIGVKILSDPNFKYDTGEEVEMYNRKNQQVLSARSFEECLAECDGTPEDFIKEFPYFCGGVTITSGPDRGLSEQPDKIQMIDTCLGDYHDIEDTMNAILAGGTTNKDLQDQGFEGKDYDDYDDEDEEDKPDIAVYKKRSDVITDRIQNMIDDL